MKAVLLSGRWAGRTRRLGLEQAAKASGDGAEVQAENAMLRDTVEFLVERLACAERRLKAAHIRRPYCLAERLHILWCIEYVRHEVCVANLRMRRVRGRSGDVPTSPEANLAGGGQGGRGRLKPRGRRGARSLSH
jgi:hypothetical protein